VNQNSYVLTFILVLTAVVAILLTGIREVTKEGAIRNENIFNKRAILSSIDDRLAEEGGSVKTLSDAEVQGIFEAKMNQIVVNTEGKVLEGVKAEDINMAEERKKPVEKRRLPIFVYNAENGEKLYILSVRGKGLWDDIWGNIALQDDLNTIAGAAFDHKGETPGLGAEIKDNPNFAAQFRGKKIYSNEGNLVSVDVKKGGAKPENPHAVDGISGATVTADGVADMLESGLSNYQPYLQQLKQTSMVTN